MKVTGESNIVVVGNPFNGVRGWNNFQSWTDFEPLVIRVESDRSRRAKEIRVRVSLIENGPKGDT